MSSRGLVLFDPSGTAHSPNALAGLARAAAGLQLVVWSPQRPDGPAESGHEWRQVETPAVLVDRRARRAYRAALCDALAATPRDWDFCDMGLGRTLGSRGPQIAASPRTVFIAHQTNAIDDRPGHSSRRHARNRQVLVGLGRRGARFVAHTERTRRRLAEFVPDDQIVIAGWPVVSTDDPCLGPAWDPPPADPTLLFAGAGRREKGLVELTRAVGRVQGFTRLSVPGRVADRLRADLDLSDPRIDIGDAYLDAAEYRESFRAASLVVLPYQRGYLEHGIFSSVLAEACAFGRPVVVSRWLAELLPEGYGGAVVADDDVDDGLARAIGEALERLPELTDRAMTEGRAFARRRHTFESYLAVLRDATDTVPS